MGFFKDMKDEPAGSTDLQPEENMFAIDDLLGDGLKDEDTEDGFDEDMDEDLLFSLLADEHTDSASSQSEPESPAGDAGQSDAGRDRKVSAEEKQDKPQEAQNIQKPEKRNELSEEEKRAVTVITKGTTINGSIISDCSLEVMGTINGDVECLGKLTISGKVKGNTMASEVYVNTERLEGSINSEGAVKVGLGTVIIGDINASSGVIAGAVKGEIDIEGPIVIDSTAIIKGNVKAGTIQMNNGAVLEGFCSLRHSAVDIDTIFE